MSSRFVITVGDEVALEARELAKVMGMRKGALWAHAWTVGIRVLQRQLQPEKFISPEIVQAFIDAGFVVPARVEAVVAAEEAAGAREEALMEEPGEDRKMFGWA